MNSKKNNLLIIKHPELLHEWDYERNNANSINVNTITCGSKIKAWWHCTVCNGDYDMPVKDKVKGNGCPFCAGRRILHGFNDLASQRPDLLIDWDYARNNANNIHPDLITTGTSINAYWSCSHCHGSYMMPVNARVRGRGCPYCAGQKVLCGFNDLMSNYPDLVNSEWDWIKNNKQGLKPDEITKSSSVKAWWRCSDYKHSFEMRVNSRISDNKGCPYCAGRKVLKGFNDLQSCYPKLVALEWDWKNNNTNHVYPDCITKISGVIAWWHCDTCDGHYEMRIADRTCMQRGCPYCAGVKVLQGYNDLASNHPDLMHDWDWIKNTMNNIHPDELTTGSNVNAYWKCHECSHEWKATIYDRTHLKHGCPKCAKRISKQENQVAEFIRNYLCSHYVNIKYSIMRSIKFKRIYELLSIHAEHVLSEDLQSHLLKELDIYIPELGFAVEYDGDYWHSDEIMMERCGLTNDEAHRIKQELCTQAGIKILFITEHDWLNDSEKMKNNIISIIDYMINNYVNIHVSSCEIEFEME